MPLFAAINDPKEDAEPSRTKRTAEEAQLPSIETLAQSLFQRNDAAPVEETKRDDRSDQPMPLERNEASQEKDTKPPETRERGKKAEQGYEHEVTKAGEGREGVECQRPKDANDADQLSQTTVEADTDRLSQTTVEADVERSDEVPQATNVIDLPIIGEIVKIDWHVPDPGRPFALAKRATARGTAIDARLMTGKLLTVEAAPGGGYEGTVAPGNESEEAVTLYPKGRMIVHRLTKKRLRVASVGTPSWSWSRLESPQKFKKMLF